MADDKVKPSLRVVVPITAKVDEEKREARALVVSRIREHLTEFEAGRISELIFLYHYPKDTILGFVEHGNKVSLLGMLSSQSMVLFHSSFAELPPSEMVLSSDGDEETEKEPEAPDPDE